MNTKSLPFFRAMRAFLLVVVLSMLGITQAIAQIELPEGAIRGKFSVSDGLQVYFSQGNLQYQVSTHTWRFAESQLDYVGEDNSNISETYDGWIDLFGWGTSGYNHGATCYQPWNTSVSYSDYSLYGNDAYNMFDQDGWADWGHNAISNGGNQENDGWRTLTHEEWDYVLFTRNTESGIRFVKAQVNDVKGLIVVPDEWSASYYVLDEFNNAESSFTDIDISADTWNSSFEPHGAVFLPAAGCRISIILDNAGYQGYYWSASCNDYYDAWDVFFDEVAVGAYHNDYYGRARGQSVRLVRDITEPVYAAFSDDFNDGEINANYWTANGSDVFEADGMIQLQQNITDDYVALESVPIAIPSDNKVVLSRKFYLHEQLRNSYWGNRYFYGSVGFKINGSDDNFIEVTYYDDDYGWRHGTYVRTKLDGEENETLICDVLFDTWQTEAVIIDVAENTLTYYRNNVLIATVDLPAVAPDYFTVRFSPYGWWTGHYQNMDWVMVNPSATTTTVAVSANLAEGGSVSGGGTFQTGQSCTVTATLNEGYLFEGWMEDDFVVSTDLEYSFVALYHDRELVAHYLKQCSQTPENLQAQVYVPRYTEADVSWESNAELFELRYGKPITPDLEEGFESGIPSNWSTIDADGDGFNWQRSSVMMSGYGITPHSGEDMVSSQSYDLTSGVLYPDNYLVTPLVNLGGVFTFWACAQDASWAAEHFGVAVSTGSQNDPADFTTLQEWTMTAKGSGKPTEVTRSGNRDMGSWYQYTVDLSDYAGQTGYIAIRHFDCSDWFYLDVDDVSYEMAGEMEWTTITGITDTYYTLTGLDDMCDYVVQVRASCGDGDYSEWVETTFNNRHYTVSVIIDPEEGGTAEGAGEYLQDAYCALQAYPSEGWQFDHWTRDDNASAWNSYFGFTVTRDVVMVAHFLRTCTLDPENVEVTAVGLTDANLQWNGQNDLYDLRYRTTNLEGFEHGILSTWEVIDADGDGYTWGIDDGSGNNIPGYQSNHCAASGSYINNVGALTPDNYLVTPQLNLGGKFTFWAAAQDPSWAAEHFGVGVSTGSQTDPADFTMVQEWTMTAKEVPAPKEDIRGSNRNPSHWYYYEVDLSEYAGQTGYVAIRHFNCTDMYFLLVDDVEYYETGAPEWTMVTDLADFSYHLEDLDMADYLVEVRSSCGDGESYSNWVGTSFTLRRYTVTVTAEPEGVGLFGGDGSYGKEETCYPWTEPYLVGYHFVNWTANGEVVSEEAYFNFTVVEDVDLVAHYEPYPEVDGLIEYTSYDWQSNKGARTWTHVWPNGDVNFAYIVAKDRDYTDRGTGIGTYHAATGEWSAVGGRVENVKSGFGSIARYGTNSLVIASHSNSDCRVYIAADKDQIETNALDAVSVLDNSYDPTWPEVMTSGANRDIIHVVAIANNHSDVPGAEGITNPVLYFRSTDGGQTWDKQNVILPFLTADYGLYWYANSFHWMATSDDNCLALVVNSDWCDGMVIYSYDDGETWERKVFYQHPDPFGYHSPFYYPRWVSCQWDSEHMLHVLYEFNASEGSAGDGGLYPQEGGVAYWNENMNGMSASYIADLRDHSWYHDNSSPMPVEYIGYLPPLTDDGDPENPYENTGFNIGDFSAHGGYNSGLCAFPVLCMVPGSDDMVAVWAAMDENHTDANGRYYYKIFGRYSANGGQAWSPMVQLTKDASCTNYEHVYLQAAVVGRTLVVVAQTDAETGTYLMGAESNFTDNFFRGFSFNLDETFVTRPMEYYAVTVTANPPEGGNVSEGSEFFEGTFLSLEAEANSFYEFVNWTFNGEVISTEPHYMATVTGDGEYTANFLPYLESLSDDFNDGEINPDYWVAVGSDIYESEGTIHIEQNVVDDDVRLTTRPMIIPESRQITMNRGIYVQTTGEPFSGGLGYCFDNNSSNYIQIAYWNDYNSDKYGTYVDAQINGEYTEVWLSDAIFDTWIDEKVELDLTAGTLSYYQGGELIATITVNGLSSLEASSFKMYFWPYGWNLGHYMFMDYINIDADATEAIITAVASIEEGGTVTGGGVYPIGETCTLTVTPSAGYSFLGWWCDGVIASYDMTYSFAVTSNHDFVAELVPAKVITVTADPVEGGTVSGDGTYEAGLPCTLQAIPAEGYLFYYWMKDGEIVSHASNYTFTPEQSGEYVAHFDNSLMLDVGVSMASGNHNYLPTNSYYNYGVTQQIYTVGEIGTACEITSLSFLNDGSLRVRTLDVYLIHTDKVAFDSDTDWVPVAETDRVFSGEVSFSEGYWTTILLDTPFDYNGTDNLALVVVDHTGTWSSGLRCRVYDAEGSQAMRLVRDTSPFDPFNMGNLGGSRITQKNAVILQVNTGQSEATITVTADPEAGGEVSGGGVYAVGETCTVTATPNAGYGFFGWTREGALVSSDDSYTFTVLGDQDLVASFLFLYDITATADPEEGGWVSGGGSFGEGEECVLSASPNLYYDFLYWTEEGAIVSYDLNYSFVVDHQGDYVAHFEQNEDVFVGDVNNNDTHYHLPSYSYYNYSLTQQIYTAEEIGKGGMISRLKFYCQSNSTGRARNLDIYMVHTDKTSFESETDWIAVTEADRVFSGEVTFLPGIWNPINLDVPFAYNGTDNLALVVDDNTGSYFTSINYRVISASNQAIRVYSDNTDYDPYDPGQYSGTVLQVKNQIFFKIGPVEEVHEQTVSLTSGWNWMSTYLECSDELFSDLKSGIAANNNTAIIKNMGGSTMLQGGSWSGTLNFTNESMYMMNVGNATEVTLSASPANPALHPIILGAGWNWIGFPSSQAMEVNEALSGLTPNNGDVIKSMGGVSSYTGSAWQGSLSTLEPGKGYMYYNKSNEPLTLVYPAAVPMVQGTVEIPEGMDASNIVVTNFSEEVVPDENGEFEIHAANMLMATNSENGKLVYFTMSSIAEYNQGRSREVNSSDLNAKETALFLTFRSLPFGLRKGSDANFNTLKEIFYSLQCVKDLEATIQNVVSTYGYLKEDELTEAMNAVKTFLYEELGFVGEKRSSMIEPVHQVPRGDEADDLQAPYLSSERAFGIYMSITESVHSDDPEQWTIHCTGMNGIPTTFGVVKGEVNGAMINGVYADFDYDEDADFYFLPPAGLTDLLDHVTDWDGVKEIIQEIRNKMQDPSSTFHADFYKTKTENMMFELPEPTLGQSNAICIIAPMDRRKVFIVNTLFAIIDVVDFAIPSYRVDQLIKDFINDHEYVTMFEAQMSNGAQGVEIILEETANKFFGLAWDLLKKAGISNVSELLLALTNLNIITNCFDIIAEVYTALYVESFAFPVRAEYTEPPMQLPEVVIEGYTVDGTTATVTWSVNSVGSLSIAEQGICYSTSPDPSPWSDVCVVAENTGIGTFESVIEGLEPDQTYYVRAYAKTWMEPLTGYSEEVISFHTSEESNTIIIYASAEPEEGGSVSGAGTYEAGAACTLTATPAAGYAFSHWTEDGVTAYTEATYSFTVTSSRNLVANFVLDGGESTVDGVLPGTFTLNANGDQVHFSQGNLQYHASTNTWRFAESQWDYVGDGTYGTVYEGDVKSNNELISSTYGGWIDLFGWGTSGYDHGAVCYQPWSTITTTSNYYAYGSESYNLFDRTGRADWGYNAISNGGNQVNLWRTLTCEEWDYLFNSRNTASGIRYSKAQVNGVNGVILLPDNWIASYYTLSNTNQSEASFASNEISPLQWTALEQHGAVFLPAAGARFEVWGCDVGSSGFYWSASFSGFGNARLVDFSDSDLNTGHVNNRYYGQSVRLVRSSQGASFVINASPYPSDGGVVTGSGAYPEGATCTLIAMPAAGYAFSHWTEDGVTVSTMATYYFTVTCNRTLVANFVLAGGDDHAYVDLGLPSGTLWATCNIGANAPEEYGDYFAWGETQPKDSYSWSNYQYCNGSYSTLTKYCSDPNYGYNGFADYLSVLLPEDDAATANWGNGWRMPSTGEWEELFNNTTSYWTTYNGVIGFLLIASNGNSLFLPATGIRDGNGLYYPGDGGNYWSNSSFFYYADCLYIESYNYELDASNFRYHGISVRPVRSSQ